MEDKIEMNSENFLTISKMAEAHLIQIKNEILQKQKLIEEAQNEIETLSSYFDEKLELLNNFQVWHSSQPDI